MKELAKTSILSPSLIISQSVRQMTPAAKGRLPSIDSLKRSVRRTREETMSSLPTPHHRRDIFLSERFTNMQNGQKFLQYDSGNSDELRFLIFTTDDNLKFLQQCEHW